MTVWILFERFSHPRDVRIFARQEDAERVRENIMTHEALDNVSPMRRKIIEIREVEVE